MKNKPTDPFDVVNGYLVSGHNILWNEITLNEIGISLKNMQVQLLRWNSVKQFIKIKNTFI